MDRKYTVNVYGLVLRYPPFASKYVRKREYLYDRGVVEVRNPLVHARPWKLFLYSLWGSKVVEEGETFVRLQLEENAGIYLGFESVKDIAEAVKTLAGVVYSHRHDEGELTFHVLEKAEYKKGEKNFYLDIPKEFYELCEEEGLRLYIPFLLYLQSRGEVGLFTFLSTRSASVERFKVLTLAERAGFDTTRPIKLIAQDLKKPLSSLVEIGFIKSFEKQGEFIKVENPPKEELRLRVIELKRQLDLKFEKLKARRRESVKKSRQKKKGQNHFNNFPF